MEALALYLLFIGTLFVGIYTGMLIERKRAAQQRIKERLKFQLPSSIKVVGNIYDKLSDLRFKTSPLYNLDGTLVLPIDGDGPFQIEKPKT